MEGLTKITLEKFVVTLQKPICIAKCNYFQCWKWEQEYWCSMVIDGATKKCYKIGDSENKVSDGVFVEHKKYLNPKR